MKKTHSILNIDLRMKFLAIRKYICTILIVGTIFSDVAVAMWYEAKVFFRDRFGKGFGRYLMVQFGYLLFNTCLLLLSMWICHMLTNGLLEDKYFLVFLVRLIVCIVVPNAVYLFVFHKTEKFRYFWRMLNKDIVI